MTTVTRDDTLTVAEVYCAVHQGEGPSAGRRCSFVRLGGCNLSCGWQRSKDGLTRVPGAWACDEAFTWHPGHGMHATLHREPARDILARLLDAGDPLIVITGGEPLLHQHHPGWQVLLGSLLDLGRDIEVETNGTLEPAWTHKRLIHNVSPKLTSSGLDNTDRIVPDTLRWHATHGSVFKFVVTSPKDVAEAAGLADGFGIPRDRTWIMPEGTTTARILDVARLVAPYVAGAGFNLTLRQQVLLYEEAGEPRDR